MPKAYLRGLTQAEEKHEGVDFFAQLTPQSRVFAFQFKAPRGKLEAAPYKYRLQREQHDLLYQLSSTFPGSVFYVLPYYVSLGKLQLNVPNLINDTWLLDINTVPTLEAFGAYQSRTVQCVGTKAFINPEYKLRNLHDAFLSRQNGVEADTFVSWYGQFRERRERRRRRRENPWLVRGLRVAIVLE